AQRIAALLDPETTTTVTASPNPSVYGQAVLMAQVTGFPANGTPTGTVQFQVDGYNVGDPITLDSNGQATATDSGLTLGSHSIVAVYSSTGAFLSSEAIVSQVNTSTTLVSSVNPSLYGQSVQFTATVNGGPIIPTGSVQFAIDGSNFGSAVTLDG